MAVSKRYGMVIDLATCLGCQACAAACTMQNETPFWDDRFRTAVDDIERGTYRAVSRTFLPRLCMHCDDPPCVSVCPSLASYKRSDGVVMIDYRRCVQCQACIAACPYGARYLYDDEAVLTARRIYGAGEQHAVAHADKCLFCTDRLAEGLEPACVATCPGGARIFGDWNDPASPVNRAMAAGGQRARRIAGTANAYLVRSTSEETLLPVGESAPAWVKIWKGGAEPVAKTMLGVSAGVLVAATVAQMVQKKKEQDDE